METWILYRNDHMMFWDIVGAGEFEEMKQLAEENHIIPTLIKGCMITGEPTLEVISSAYAVINPIEVWSASLHTHCGVTTYNWYPLKGYKLGDE